MFTMEDRNSYEKLSIRESARFLKKYGSTSKHVAKNENFIKHTVMSGDTLQGLALKYGVTMEQIRRVNRLWASDSLFLREHILIPTDDNTIASPSSQPVSMSTTPSTSQMAPVGSFDEDANNFLDKIDASIASTKEEVRKSQGHSEFAVDADFIMEKKKPATSRMKKNINNNTADLLMTPLAVVKTQGHKLQSSMKQYERQQDELFEL